MKDFLAFILAGITILASLGLSFLILNWLFLNLGF